MPPTPRSLVGVSTDRHRRVIREALLGFAPERRTPRMERGREIGVPPIRHPPVLTQHPRGRQIVVLAATYSPDRLRCAYYLDRSSGEDTDFFVTTGPCNEDTCAIGPIAREDAIQPQGMGISLSWPDFGNSASDPVGRSLIGGRLITASLSARFSVPYDLSTGGPGYSREKQVETLRDANTSTLIINRRC